jgi:hypothetical protein
MAYKSKKKSPKKMKMGGDYLEPNKELNFGGMKKGKYQAAGARERIPKVYLTPESKADPKKAPDYRRTTSGTAGTGRPLKSGTKGTPVKSSGTAAGPSMAEKVAAENALKSGPGARERKQNTPQGTGKGREGKSGSTVAKVAPRPQPKRAEKLAIRGPKKAERDDKTERTIKKSNMSTVKVKAPSKIKSSTPSPTLKTKEAPKSKKEARINKRAERVTARKAKAEAPTRLERKEARIDRRTDRVLKRKDKKAGIKAAKARLKAARRLEPGGLKPVPSDNKGLPNLPKKVRNKMGYLKRGGKR